MYHEFMKRELVLGRFRYRIVDEDGVIRVFRCPVDREPFVREETCAPGFTSDGIRWVFIHDALLVSLKFTSQTEAEQFIKDNP